MSGDREFNALERAWWAGAVQQEAADRKAEAAREGAAAKRKAAFNDDPDDLVHDPRAGQKLSRFGQDKGARRRATVTEHAGVGDEVQLVSRVMTGLDRMRRGGTISEDEYSAAVVYQNEFDRAGYQNYVRVNLHRTGGGVSDDIIVRAQAARDYIGHVTWLLGGGGNPMTTVVFWSLGMGYGFDAIAAENGDNKHFWRGVFISAIRIMGDDYKKMLAGRRRNRDGS